MRSKLSVQPVSASSECKLRVQDESARVQAVSASLHEIQAVSAFKLRSKLSVQPRVGGSEDCE
jgi:hypothetical protein